MNKNPKFSHLSVYKYKAGQSGNIKGRPRSYITILKELGYTKPMIATMVAEIMMMGYKEVNEIACSSNEPIIRVAIAKAFIRAAGYKGENKYIAPYLEILFGRQMPFIPEAPTSEDKELE